MVYLLVTWEGDNSLRFINSNVKAIIFIDREKFQVSLAQQGIYDGSIIDSSDKAQQVNKFCSYFILDSKQEMESKARVLADGGNCKEQQETVAGLVKGNRV